MMFVQLYSMQCEQSSSVLERRRKKRPVSMTMLLLSKPQYAECLLKFREDLRHKKNPTNRIPPT